jgi:hypothetical protein
MEVSVAMFCHDDRTPATPNQLRTHYELDVDVGQDLSRRQADELIKENMPRWRALEPSPKQQWFLCTNGLWHEGMTRGEGCDVIAQFKERTNPAPVVKPRNKRRPKPPPQDKSAWP